jgi:hypothetical protein
MRLDLLEGVRTLQWFDLHPPHASGIMDTLNHLPPLGVADPAVLLASSAFMVARAWGSW